MKLDNALEYARRRMEDIKQNIYVPLAPLECRAFEMGENVDFAARELGRALDAASPLLGEARAPVRAWLNFSAKVPKSAAGRPIAARLRLKSAALIVDGEGAPAFGLAAPGATDAINCADGASLPLMDSAEGGEDVDFWVDCVFDADAQAGGQLCAVQQNMRRLYYDMLTLMDLAEALPEGGARRVTIIGALSRALEVLTDMSDERALAATYALAPELNRKSGETGFALSAIGGARPGAAWARSQAESAQIGAREYSRALYLMQSNDEYVFGATEPGLYEAVAARYPELRARIKERVNQGRWELTGAMWADADAGTSSGEALVRQLLYGKRYCAREFGQDVTLLYLADAALGPAQLPQLMLKSGIQYFLNASARRQQRFDFPYSSFWWQGMDGSRVLAHVLPGEAQCAALPADALRAEREFSELGLADGALMVYGGADGPDAGHMERLKREGELMGMPPIRGERAVEFFDRLRKSRVELPVWEGEIPIDCRQGAYSARPRLKRLNRRVENALNQLELICVAMHLRGAEYPKRQLADIWKRALACQRAEPENAGGQNCAALERELAELLANIGALQNEQWGGENGLDVVLNPHAWTIDMWLDDRADCLENEALRVTLPPLSASSTIGARKAALPARACDDTTLENDRLRLKFDERGRMASALDKKQGWELLRGAGNQLSVYEDDGDMLKMGRGTLKRRVGVFSQASVSCEIAGAKCRRTAVYKFEASTLTQTVELTAGSARVDFINKLSWRESGKLLRAEFPLNINPQRFLCDTQFGCVERPVNRNTGREWAMSEAGALKYLSLNQTGRGAALMTDGGYGCACLDNVLSLSLVRAPREEATPDAGDYEFRYALYPNAGDVADIARQACAFDQPPVPTSGVTFGSLCWLDAKNIMPEAIKLAEDSDDIVLRMYELTGASCAARLKTGFAVAAASVCDLMERVTSPLTVDGGDIVLDFAPFEIKTVMLTLKKPE